MPPTLRWGSSTATAITMEADPPATAGWIAQQDAVGHAVQPRQHGGSRGGDPDMVSKQASAKSIW